MLGAVCRFPRMKNVASKLVGFALMVLGAKLWLIGAYGVAVPLWDAWRQEGIRVYKPFLEGEFTPDQLFINNNVHHIACTRLYDLALFVLDGRQWDLRAELVANALLHVVGCTGILAMLYDRLGRRAGDLALVALGLCLALPCAYVNTLWGFQSQFYFLVSLSLVTLWGLLSDPQDATGRSLLLRRACGCLAAFLACFSMGSGFLAAGISAVLIAGRAWWRGRWRREVPGLVAGLAAAGLGLWLFASALSQIHSRNPGDAGARDATLAVVLGRLANGARLGLDVGATAGWPLGGGTYPWGGLFLYGPFALWLWRRWRHRHPGDEPAGGRLSRAPDRWFFAGFGLWALAQATSIGLLRGVPPGSRHLDALCFGLVVNVLALGSLWREGAGRGAVRPPRQSATPLAGAGTLLWLVLTTAGLFNNGLRTWRQDLPAWKEQMPIYQRSIEQFAATDDSTFLKAKAPFFPQPKPAKMLDILEDSGLRAALPSVFPQPEGRMVVPPPTLTQRGLNVLVPLAVPISAVGILLLAVVFGVQLGTRRKASAPGQVGT